MKPIHLTVAAGGVASVLAASIGAYALGHHNGSQGGDTGPKVAVHGTPTPSPQASPTGSSQPTQIGTPGAVATSPASTSASRTQSTHTVTVVTTPKPTPAPTQTQTSSSSQTSSSTSSVTSTPLTPKQGRVPFIGSGRA